MTSGDTSVGASAIITVRCRLLGSIDVRNVAGDEVRSLLVQPKRLALFVYLVLRGAERLARRDTLLALFWPESSEEAARHSLRQALHGLRQELGPDALIRRGNEDVGIDARYVSCDVTDFVRAVDDRRHADALTLYRGQLLEGFHVPGVVVELERWLEEERSRLHALAIRAGHTLIEEAERDGNLSLAARSARDAVRLDPFDERTVRRLMMLLHATGDRAGALRAYDAFAAGMLAEFELRPSTETIELAERMRSDAGGRQQSGGSHRPGETNPSPARTSGGAAATGTSNETINADPSVRSMSGRRLVATLAILAPILLVSGALMTRVVSHARSASVLAVGSLRVEARDSLSPRLVREVLATDLARLQGVDVVSVERMDELRARIANGSGDTMSASRIAERAGASEVIEGILSGGGAKPLRFDVRLVDPGSGIIRAAHAAEANDIFTLADAVTAWIARGRGYQPPGTPLREATSTSLVARRFYDEGLRALNQGDMSGALRLFRAALAEDSTFVTAAYYAAQSAWSVYGDTAGVPLLARALRASGRATERERLFAEAAWANATNSPAAIPIAESLATRYPMEPEGGFSLGAALLWSGDRGRAIPWLERAVERDAAMLDSAPGDTSLLRLPCRACDALASLVAAYMEGDSLQFAERAARNWTRRQPANYRAWTTLAQVLEYQGRVAEALAAQREASRRAGRDLASDVYRAILAIRAGDFATADRLLTVRATAGSPTDRIDAMWWLAISLRCQEKLDSAFAVAERMTATEDSASHSINQRSATRLARGAILLELGRARQAAAAFEAFTAAPVAYPTNPPLSVPGVAARHRAWGLTLAATAYAAAGDTARLLSLADSVASAGRQSLYGRDRKLAFFIRGLLYEARHDYAGAERAFRDAIFSPNVGYTRVNLELARVLIAQARAQEAVPVLQSALRGGLEGSNYYVTRTELYAMLARAFEAAGKADSARAYRRRVAAARGRRQT